MRGNYSGEETIQGGKLFKGGNYSRAETIWGNTVVTIKKALSDVYNELEISCIMWQTFSFHPQQTESDLRRN